MSIDSELPPFLRVEQVQELTQLGRAHVYKQAARFLETDGAEGIPCVRWGRSLRFPTHALLRLGEVDGTWSP